jgi:hypothetical protein
MASYPWEAAVSEPAPTDRDGVLAANRQVPSCEVTPPDLADPLFLVANQAPDGTYSVSLTAEGIEAFETALGIAQDLGGRSTISPSSTIGDIRERAALREELSAVRRQSGSSRVHALRLAVVRRRLQGSNRPSAREKLLGHVGRVGIVGLVLVWTVMQFLTSVLDVAAIPGILAGIPGDLLQLHPLSAVTDSGAKLSDAGLHLLYGVVGVVLTFVAAMLVRPFSNIYRRDQVLIGQRAVMRWAAAWLRRADVES